MKIETGVTKLRSHAQTPKHKDNVKRDKKPSRFCVAQGGISSVSVTTKLLKLLTTEDPVLRAEVIRCLDVVDCSLPFHSSNTDNEKYSRMFPDTEIVKCYQQKENKVKYLIQFGIASTIRKTY